MPYRAADVMPDVRQAMCHPNSLQKFLYNDVVEPYRNEDILRGMGLHIKASGTNEGSIVIYRQISFKSRKLEKEKPVVEIKHPYFPNDVVVKDPRYGKLGQRVKNYIDKLYRSETVLERLKVISRYPLSEPHSCVANSQLAEIREEIRGLNYADFMQVLDFVRDAILPPNFKQELEMEHSIRNTGNQKN